MTINDYKGLGSTDQTAMQIPKHRILDPPVEHQPYVKMQARSCASQLADAPTESVMNRTV